MAPRPILARIKIGLSQTPFPRPASAEPTKEKAPHTLRGFNGGFGGLGAAGHIRYIDPISTML
jgi:hypothetical protein